MVIFPSCMKGGTFQHFSSTKGSWCIQHILCNWEDSCRDLCRLGLSSDVIKKMIKIVGVFELIAFSPIGFHAV